MCVLWRCAKHVSSIVPAVNEEGESPSLIDASLQQLIAEYLLAEYGLRAVPMHIGPERAESKETAFEKNANLPASGCGAM